MQRPRKTRKWPTGARNFGRHVKVHQYVQTLREGEGRLWTEGLGTPRQAGCILKDQHLGLIGWSRDRQLSAHTSAVPEQANKTEHYPL